MGLRGRALGERLTRAFLLQAAAIAVAAVLGVYFAGVVLEDVLITQALRDEAAHFWRRLDHDPSLPPPDTANLTGYLSGADPRHAPPATLSGLGPGFHRLDAEGSRTVFVDARGASLLYLVFDGDQVDALAAYFGLVPLALVLLVLYLSTWLAYRAAQRAVSPITRLARQVDSLDAAAPDPRAFDPARFALDADHEVHTLAAALARFAERLNALVERERNFTRDASHELRSPLTVIRLAADVLLADQGLTSQARATVDRIRRAADDMGELVEVFLLLAREADTGPASTEVCINEVIAEELERARTLAANERIGVEVQAECLLYARAPVKVLAVLLGNLLRNAFAYTDAGQVAVRIAPGEVVIADSGVGMTGEQLGRVFEAYVRAQPARRGGHGVGLNIVKRLSERFDWPIEIHSRPGEGTRVRVRFANARTAPLPRSASA